MPLSKEQKQQLSKIRQFIKDRDFATVTQGFEILTALNDPDLWELFTEGLCVSPDGVIELALVELKKLVSKHHRA